MELRRVFFHASRLRECVDLDALASQLRLRGIVSLDYDEAGAFLVLDPGGEVRGVREALFIESCEDGFRLVSPAARIPHDNWDDIANVLAGRSPSSADTGQATGRDEASREAATVLLNDISDGTPEGLADLIFMGLDRLPPRPVDFSIVINNFNYADYLADAIESALSQTLPASEIIVVDDGSSDSSREIIGGYKNIVPVLKENGGQASAFNAGFQRATGDVIIFLDADDRLLPDALERLSRQDFRRNARVSYPLAMIDETGRQSGLYPVSRSAAEGHLEGTLLHDGFFLFMPTSGNAFSRRALENILPMLEEEWRICADLYVILASAFQGPSVHLEEVLGQYRTHSSNRHYRTLGREDFLNDRKFAQRRRVLGSLAAAMKAGHFGNARMRTRLNALRFRTSENLVKRAYGLALGWLADRSEERSSLKYSAVEFLGGKRRPPRAFRRVASARISAVFGGPGTWPHLEEGSIIDLAGIVRPPGVLGRGWQRKAGKGAELVDGSGTLCLAFGGVRANWELHLGCEIDGPGGTIEIWLNGTRVAVRTLETSGIHAVVLPSDLLEFDADLQRYAGRVAIRGDVMERLTLVSLMVRRHHPNGAAWLAEETLIEGSGLGPYLTHGWDWQDEKGWPLVGDQGDLRFSLAGRRRHAVFLRFDDARATIALNGGMVSPEIGRAGECSVDIPENAVAQNGLVRLDCLSLGETGISLNALRLDAVRSPDMLLPGRRSAAADHLAAPGRVSVLVPSSRTGFRLWLSLDGFEAPEAPVTVSVSHAGKRTTYVLAGLTDICVALDPGASRRHEIALDLPDGVRITEISLSPRAGSTVEVEEPIPSVDIARWMADSADWHPQSEGVFWMAGPDATLRLLPAPGATRVRLEFLTLPEPLQTLAVTLGGVTRTTSEAGRSVLVLPMPGPVEDRTLHIRSDTLVAKAALGIAEPGFLGGALAAVTFEEEGKRQSTR